MLFWIAAISFLAWVFLLLLRGGFWRADCYLPDPVYREGQWPSVTAVVPARNEADVIGRSVRALFAQEYPGAFNVLLVDDESDDGTADAARAAAEAAGRADRLTVLRAEPLPPGWSGKLWALAQGIRRARAGGPAPAYLWLSDADILPGTEVLRRLVAKAEDDKRDLVSLMALLEHEGFWSRLLIPPFVFFFQKLYPFPWSNDPRSRTAAAAGGCNLVNAEALASAGGIEAIRDALIDDCTLAALIKGNARLPGKEPGRGIWVGLTRSVVSIRPYRSLDEVWRMVSRSAYTQLRHSPLLLAGTVFGMALLYLAPLLIPLTLPLHGSFAAAVLAAGAWCLMAYAAWPTYRLYREAPWRPFLLPIAGLLYTAMTLDSARLHHKGQGGQWKGRIQAPGQQSGSVGKDAGSPHDGAAPLDGPPSGG